MKLVKMISVTTILIYFVVVFISLGVQKDKGIGPIKSFKVNALDMNLAKKGKMIFDSKCAVCHQMDSKKIGPPLRDEFNKQSPEFIMNLLLNTSEMQRKNEYIKNLIRQYNNVLMIDYKLSENDAKSLLEYLRAASQRKM